MSSLSDIYSFLQLTAFGVVFVGVGFIYGFSFNKWLQIKLKNKRRKAGVEND